MDDTKNNLSTEDVVSNQPGSGKVAGDYELEMKFKTTILENINYFI